VINKIEQLCQINIKKLHKQTRQIRLNNRLNLLNRNATSVNQTRDYIYKWLNF
jgi:hypothetical protein